MTAFDYSGIKATAEGLIERFGQAGTLTQTANSGTAYDPTRVDTDHTVNVALLNFKTSEIDGTVIQQGDKKAYLSTDDLTVVPVPGDKLNANSEDHRVMMVEPINPGGTVVVYKLQVRK